MNSRRNNHTLNTHGDHATPTGMCLTRSLCRPNCIENTRNVVMKPGFVTQKESCVPHLKIQCLLLLTLALTGCGTINTTFRPDSVAGEKLTDWKSNCSSIPRVYSGVMLDFCELNAEPKQSSAYQKTNAPEWVLLDMGLSGIVDTLLLPYTIYQQNQYGYINASRFK
ncbi:Lipoprotein [Pseudomonas amygdali pv. hibisci]|nr:Lipoprotein [Pseudomonas amygdali pv. lachrymans]RMN59529.1 Lipoprotein [Pseudomonas amygdali pv. hibisci]RMT09516.1 Lipoprotein [Pseudomonas amygdali pv. lachrymans]